MKTLHVKSVYIEYSNASPGFQSDTKLMVHQAEVRDATEKLVIVTSPPSSGKTLANLLRIDKEKKDAVIIYPTNELIEDQASSLEGLIRDHLKKKVTTLSADSLQHCYGTTDYVLIRANSEALERDGMAKGTVLRSMLSISPGRRIVLTNLELINLLAKSFYHKSEDIFRFLQNFNIFIIDEFHMYTGISLANLIFTLYPLKNISQIILSSATPSKVANIFECLFKPSRTIKAKVYSSPTGHQIRYPTKLLLKPLDQILGGKECAQQATSFIKELYERHKSDTPSTKPFIKVLAIVNSVAFCAQLWESLRNEFGEDKVGMISGLVPKKARERKEITVATSTVEVGVDFDVASLFFEARDPITFIQRLCRGARHRPCDVVAYVPPELLEKSEEIPDEIGYSQLEEIVQKKLCVPEEYGEFLTSNEAGELLCGFLLGFLRLHPNEDFGKYLHELRRLLEEPNRLTKLVPPLQNASALLSVFQNTDPRVLKAIASSGPRGGAGSIPVVYDKIYGEKPVLGYVSVRETGLLCVSESVTRGELLKKFDLKVPSWVQGNILVVNGFLEEPVMVKCTCRDENLMRPALLNGQNFCVHTGIDSLNDVINEVICNSVIGYFTRAPRVDWRFQWLSAQNARGKVVMGGDAFVQYFLDKKFGFNA
jgi:CRISPR-associated helicase Cas3